MKPKQAFRRDAARKAGQMSGSRVFSLGGFLVVTAVAAVLTVVLAVPLSDARERQMDDAARDQLRALLRAVEEYRAVHYRYPDRVEELESAGYSPSPATVICRFRHNADVRNFDDHIEVALRHRGSGTALVTRYPSDGQPLEGSATEECADRQDPRSATR